MSDGMDHGIGERKDAERVLIVEDDEAVAGLLLRILRNAGYRETQSISDARRALPVFREWEPDLIIMDVRMPHIDGIAAMQQIRSRINAGEFLPFLLITGDSAAETRKRALEAGASDFLTKPFDSSEVLLRVRNLLALRRVQNQLTDALHKSEAQLQQAQLDLIERLTLAVKLGTPKSGSDPDQVGELSALIARVMGLHEDEVNSIRLAAPLHDIGMIGVSDRIVDREGSLSLEELDEMRAHTALGAKVLTNSDMPLLQLAEEIALYHHEAWNGHGYIPDLAGRSIPLAARIVAVADTYCAMTGQRQYQNSHSRESAISWIEGQAGTRFDPDVVEAFKRVWLLDDLPRIEPRERTE